MAHATTIHIIAMNIAIAIAAMILVMINITIDMDTINTKIASSAMLLMIATMIARAITAANHKDHKDN